jgi:tetratricopeptide (TPR) repeat protein
MLAVGDIIDGKYRIEGHLGGGGMADVYKATQTSLNRTVALKVLKQEFNSDAVMVERFRVEAERASQINHPNIVGVFDVGEDAAHDIYYFAMQYVEGESLAQILQREGALSPDWAIQITQQVCDALEHAHRNGIVHRDIKPENIMIDSSGRVVLTDFGIAKAADGSRLTKTGETFGTPQYMSPEQCSGQPIDGRSDIYSLGIVLYQMLTGRVPFGSADTPAVAIAQAHINQPPAPPRQINPSIPAWLEQIVMIAIAKNPMNRYQRAHEMSNALQAGAAGYKPKKFRHREDVIGPTKRAQSPVMVIAASVVSLLLIVGAIFAIDIVSQTKKVNKFFAEAEGLHANHRPQEADAVLNKAFVLRWAGMASKYEAAQNLRGLIQGDCKRLEECIKNISEILIPGERWPDLSAEFKKGLDIDPDNAAIASLKQQAVTSLTTKARQALEEGIAALNDRKYEEAVVKFGKCIELAEHGIHLDSNAQFLSSAKTEAEKEILGVIGTVRDLVVSNVNSGDNYFNGGNLGPAASSYNTAIRFADILLKFEKKDISVQNMKRRAEEALDGISTLNQISRNLENANNLLNNSHDFNGAVQTLNAAENLINNAPAVLRNPEKSAFKDAKFQTYYGFGVIYKAWAKSQLDDRLYNSANTNCDNSLKYINKAVAIRRNTSVNQVFLETIMVNIAAYVRSYHYGNAVAILNTMLQNPSSNFSVESVGDNWFGWRYIGEIYAILFDVALKDEPQIQNEIGEIKNMLPPDFNVSRVPVGKDLLELVMKNFELYVWITEDLGGTPPENVKALHLLFALIMLQGLLEGLGE